MAFADSRDAGRDGAFYGSWADANDSPGDAPSGPFALQCKHSKKEDSTLSPSMLTDEFEKAKELAARGLCRTYVLLTNARATGVSEAAIRKQLLEVGVKHVLVLDGNWLSQTIAFNSALRMFVPRVYGLGDLSQILDERAYTHAWALLSTAPERASTFVVTSSYTKAVQALRESGFVMLLGEPAIGKSTVALMLALSAADSWGCSVIKARNSDELVRRWNPHEANQFFWIDDAFGSVRHEERLTDDWLRDLPYVMSAVRHGARVVLTSRTYIYNYARAFLKAYAYPLLEEQRVVVDVADLTRDERCAILYNHLAAGDQPPTVRAAIKPHLEAAADVDAFLPETARRLGVLTTEVGDRVHG